MFSVDILNDSCHLNFKASLWPILDCNYAPGELTDAGDSGRYFHPHTMALSCKELQLGWTGLVALLGLLVLSGLVVLLVLLLLGLMVFRWLDWCGSGFACVPGVAAVATWMYWKSVGDPLVASVGDAGVAAGESAACISNVFLRGGRGGRWCKTYELQILMLIVLADML